MRSKLAISYLLRVELGLFLSTWQLLSSLEEGLILGWQPRSVQSLESVSHHPAGVIEWVWIPIVCRRFDVILKKLLLREECLLKLAHHVWVSKSSLDDTLHTLPSSLDIWVLRIAQARGSVFFLQKLYFLGVGNEFLPTFGLDVVHPLVHLVGQILVELHARVEGVARDISRRPREETSLEVSRGRSGNGMVLSLRDSKSNCREHLTFRRFLIN